MGAECSVKPKTALEGVHGVQVAPHSPFALEEIKQHGDLHKRSHASFPVGTRQHLIVQRVWQQRPGCLRPIRCSCHGDKTIAETIANVITSLPFIALGLQAPRKNLHCKLYANSLIGVGIVSSLYHASRGKIRRYMRWADYSMIATATVCLSRALRNENPKLLMAASAVLLPIQPLMVSAVHTGMMEVAFAKRAFQDPDLRMTHNVHKMSSLLGGALFIADDVFPETPFLHAGWHLAAAVGMIEKALQELNEKGGSSEESISDFIKKEHKSLPWAHTTMLKHHLQKLTDQGEILMIDGRFLLPGDSESVNPKRKRKRKCTKRKKRGNSEIKQKSVQMEKEENKQVQHDDVEAVREQKDLDEQKSKVNEEYRELNEHHNEPSTDKEDGQLSGQQNGVTGNKVFHRRILRSTVHKQKGKELFDATEGSLQSSVAIGSGIGSTPVEPPRFMMTEETEHLQDLELQQSKLSITTVEETAGDNLPQLLSPEAPPRFEFLALEDATANKAHTFSSIGLDLPKEDRVMHQSSDRPSKEEAAAEDLLKTEKQQKKHHGWQQTNRPITRAQAKRTVTPNKQPISGRNRTQVKLAMESSSEPKQPSIENSTETDRAQRQLRRWSKNPGEPKSVSTSKVEPLALCDSADQQLVLVEEPLSIQIEEPLAMLIREEAMNLTDPQYEVRLKQPRHKRRKKALKDKDDGTDSDTILLKDMRSTKKLAKKKNDRGRGRHRNAH